MARHASWAFLIACGAAAIVTPASADTVKFYTGTTGYGGPFNGSGTVYDVTKNDATACPATFACANNNDIRTTPEVFNLADGLTITATVLPSGTTTNPNQVWDDRNPNFGGLGVGRKNGDSDTDQIAGSDVLTLTFTNSSNVLHNVNLTGVATLFASAHEGFGSNFDSSSDVSGKSGSILFWLAVNGSSTFTPVHFDLANNNGLNITGNTFSFKQDPFNYRVCRDDDDECRYKPGPQFYVSALEFLNNNCDFPNVCTHQGGNTPLPAAVWLFGSVIAGGAGVSRWRKSRKVVRAVRAAVPGERAELAKTSSSSP